MELTLSPHPPHDPLDYNYITDGMYIGTNQCCTTHFDEALQKEGISADVSLEEERIDAPFGVEFYVWIPIKNHTAPTHGELEFGVAVLEKLVAMKRKIYVHCKNGHGRAPTMVAAYLIKKGKKLTEALDLLKAQRSSVHLEGVQIQALEQWT